ncbi:SAM-dependent methyltransferase [Nocardia sp. NPDC059246]|uniref:SAM-dependent methyltransferase n=1 Tax=unclassified Nocardia TaxID=2637762 RepID=UPI003683BAC1
MHSYWAPVHYRTPRLADEARFGYAQYARTHDYLLGGKNSYAEDRDLGERLLLVFPDLRESLWASREFQLRATRGLAAEGVGQFLELGAGYPSNSWAVHTVAREVNPEAKVLYVDFDPIVAAHHRAFGIADDTDFLEADITDTVGLIEQARPILDFGAPMVVSLCGVLEHIENAAAVVRTLSTAVAPGSFLVISHIVTDSDEQLVEAIAAQYRNRGLHFHPRSSGDLSAMFSGRGLVVPGMIQPDRWHVIDDGPLPVDREQLDGPAHTELHCRATIGRRLAE